MSEQIAELTIWVTGERPMRVPLAAIDRALDASLEGIGEVSVRDESVGSLPKWQLQIEVWRGSDAVPALGKIAAALRDAGAGDDIRVSLSMVELSLAQVRRLTG